MLRRIILLALIGALLFSSGCSCLLHTDILYGPKVTGDGTGGGITVYADIKGDGADIYAQKIDPGGKTLWRKKGVLIGDSASYSFFSLHIVSDGSGGALVSWSESSSSQQRGYISQVASVDSEGNVRWQREVRGVDHMIGDGAGGTIIATDNSYDEKTSFIIKIDADGNFPWGENGVSIVSRNIYQSHSLGLAEDGAGGAIIIWEELQTEPGPEPHRPKTTNHIFAQRINAEGSLPWGQEGVLLYTTPEGAFSAEPKIISDVSGGAIAVWMQVPKGRIEEGSPKALLYDFYVQRVNADGDILWQANGVPLEIVKSVGKFFPADCPLPVSDGSGGAIIIWRDMRNPSARGSNIYAQRIDADGSLKWQAGGVEVASASLNPNYPIVNDGSGGAIIAYNFQKGLHFQKLDADGRVIWRENGVSVADGDYDSHFISYDGHGGAVIAWGIGKDMFSSEKSYVQRISADGKLLWGDKGIRLIP